MIKRYALLLLVGLIDFVGLDGRDRFRSRPAQPQSRHWSFNSGTITKDAGGNVLTAADSTGAHNATTQALGTGAITSIAGPFGRAASFNNANANGQGQTTNNVWMSFPQLTEIAGAYGGRFFGGGLGERSVGVPQLGR